ncbi:MAG: transcription termination/antitermination protein NusG [Opitutales bacterium]|jgi:transcriptional antiterminator RfaH
MNAARHGSWFCVKSRPRQESVAARNLTTLGGVEVLMPRVRRLRKGHDGPRHVVEPLFPGYLFARYEPDESHGPVRSTRGVLHVVSQGGRAVEVQETVIAELLALGPDATLSLEDPLPDVGQRVRVIRGVFEGSEGEVLRLASPQRRVAVLMTLLGGEQAVDLSLDDVEGLSES